MRRISALAGLGLALLPTAAACGGALRLYPGAPRPLLEIARVRGSLERSEEDGATLETRVDVLAVDGVAAVGFEWIELEPGPAVVRAAARETYAGAETWRLEDELRFEALPGGDYAVRAVPSERARPVALTVWDERFERCVASNEPTLADLPHPTLDLGPEWTLADWFAGIDTHSFTYLPAGEALGGWTRVVEVQFHAVPNRAVRAGELEERLHDLVAARCDDEELRFVARGDGDVEGVAGIDGVGATWAGACTRTGRQEWGVALLRPAPGGVELCAHVDTLDELEPDEVAAWLERFRGARGEGAPR